MDKSTYLKLIEDGYTHIPVYKEIIADLISPLYVYSNFQNMENTIFLFRGLVPLVTPPTRGSSVNAQTTEKRVFIQRRSLF